MSTLSSAEIGQRIKELRKKKKFSQQDLADKLRRSLRTVQKYETGEIIVPIPVLNEIAFYLGTTSAYLLGNESDEKPITNFADVIELLFKLEEIPGIHFNITVNKPPFSDWRCSLTFNGKENKEKEKWNQTLCLFLEDWSNKQMEFSAYYGHPTLPSKMDDYQEWKEMTLSYYSKIPLVEEGQDND